PGSRLSPGWQDEASCGEFIPNKIKPENRRLPAAAPGMFSENRLTAMKHPLIRNLFISISLTLLSIGTACGEKTVVDPIGRTVHVPDHPLRIISMAPSVTEIIFALEHQHRLVGVTRYSNYTAAAGSLPRVGSYVRLDMERILALRPDLCIAVKDGNPINVVTRLMELGIPVYAVDPHNIAVIIETVQALGDLLEAGENTGRLVQQMQQKVERIRDLVATRRNRPRVFLQIGISPLVSVGPNTLADELITLAGGRNVVTGNNLYPVFSREQILGLAPEVLIITSMAREKIFADIKREWQEWPQLPAVRNQRLYLINSDLTDRPSPRLLEGLECLTAAIHPELLDMRGLNCQ
ncbi:MAG: cobalamin-binding protein, partial [bacterium]